MTKPKTPTPPPIPKPPVIPPAPPIPQPPKPNDGVAPGPVSPEPQPTATIPEIQKQVDEMARPPERKGSSTQDQLDALLGNAVSPPPVIERAPEAQALETNTHHNPDFKAGEQDDAPRVVPPAPPVLEQPPTPAPPAEPPVPEFKPTVVLEPGQQLPPELAGFPPPPPLPDLPPEPVEEPIVLETIEPPPAPATPSRATPHLPVDPIAAERTRAELEAGRAALIAGGHDPDAPRPALQVAEPASPVVAPNQPTNFSGRIPQSTLDEQAAGRAVIQRKQSERELVAEQERKRRADAAQQGAAASASDLDYREK